MNKKLFFLPAVFVIVGLMSAMPVYAKDTLVQVDIPFTKYVLDNGLTLIVHEDHKAPIAAVNIWYHVGSKNERPGRTGFAHLFEHLMFNGSEHYNDDYFKLLEPVGATTLNGTTNFDRTNYFQNVPTSALDLVLWAESDRMGYLLEAIDQDKLEEQRGVVLNEKKQGENQPYGKVMKYILEGIFPKGHPYSWPVIGLTEDIEAATLEDVHEWFKEYYGPANAVICIAGDIDPETVKAKVEKYFGDIPSGPPITRPEKWIARRTGMQRKITQDRVQLPLIIKLWNTPENGTPGNDYLGLVGNILSTGKTSRLYQRLVYEDQIAVDVGAYPLALEIASGFGITAFARPGIDLAVVERAIDEELDRFLRTGPTEKELKRVKNQRIAGFIRGIEKIGGFGGKSDILISHEVYRGDPGAYNITLERIQKANRKDLLNTAREWLSDGQFVLEVHPFPQYKTSESELDRNNQPETGEPPLARFPSFERTKLSNGLDVIIVENHSIPILIFRLLIDAGYASDRFAAPGVAGMAMDMMDEGTDRRSTLEISEELLTLGAQLGTWANLDQCGVSLNTLTSTLDESLDIYLDVIFNPTFPDKELNRLKKERIAIIRHEKTEPDSMALRVLPKLLYGEDHAYSMPLTGSGTEESVNNIRIDDLKKFHETWFKPNNATLIVIGDIIAKEIPPTIEKAFGKWKQGDVPKKNLSKVEHRQESSIYIIDKPGAEQSVIFAGHIAPPKANPDEFAIETMNVILGGKFTSRLNMNLREDKHWTYGARTSLYAACGQRPFYAQTPVQTDKTKESMIEIKKEFSEIVSNRPPTNNEIELTKKNQTLKLSGQWETMSAISGSLSNIVRYDLPENYYETYAENIMALTDDGVANAARTLIHPDRLVWVIVGDRAKIENSIKELNYGSVYHIDADGNPVD